MKDMAAHFGRKRRSVERALLTLGALFSLAAMPSCSKPPASSRIVENSHSPETRVETVPEISTPVVSPSGQLPMIEPDELPAIDPAILEQRFRATASAGERAEIAQELCGLNTAKAAETARRLFGSELDQDVKVELLTGLVEMDLPEERPRNLTTFMTAVSAAQPHDVREVAISFLGDSGDPRAIQILLNLSSDPNAEIREAAAEAVEELRLVGK